MTHDASTISNARLLTAAGARPRTLVYDYVKRGFDLAAALIGLVALSPLFALIAALIKRDSPGPVFYRGPRAGFGGVTFHILKFRTMYECPDSYAGPAVTEEGDERVTPLGRWLRDTKLNELPQLWNVLKGDMSLVGPRPEDPEIAADWPEDIRAEILSVRPGLTSPASVQFRNEESLLAHQHAERKPEDVIRNAEYVMRNDVTRNPEDAGPEKLRNTNYELRNTHHAIRTTYMEYIVPSKLRLDQLYVRNRSFWLDLDVLLWTSLVLLPAAGAYQPPEAVLFWGPVSKLVRRYLTWFTVDTLVTLTAVGLAGVFWRFFVVLNVGWERSAMIALSFALLFSLSGTLFGIHKVAWSKANAEEAMDLLPPVLFAGLIAYFGNLFFNPTPLPRGMVVLASALALAGFGLVRYRGRLLSGLASRWLGLRGGAHLARERVLIVGGGESGQVAAWLLSQRRADNAMWVVGFVDDDLYKQGVRIQGSKVLGKCADIPHLLKQFDVGVVVFAIHNILSEERARLLEACRRPGIRLVEVPDVLALLRGTGRG